MTSKELWLKRIRNWAGFLGMLCALALMVIPVSFFAKTFIVEAIALTFFGISWLVKGQALGILKDK